ncbi:hypothetical protein E4582_00825 [Luteimonas yindakuii]|uniref:Uncharacterized protein n=1 Tax=Luteimonas yindakuii TaxID=2565782 RepID=A0A4Z1R9T0_9GAMM|nr:diacylglycerol kinase [Luteimonas yindakuii]TKS53458.1 hypothetical protein E4582_00825 [Luteimonas yindakuii]
MSMVRGAIALNRLRMFFRPGSDVHAGKLPAAGSVPERRTELAVELPNTALDATIDRVGRRHHPLSGKAKDAGSVAVAAALRAACWVWACVPW